MHFTEVAVQNVRGFSAAGRIALKPGYLTLVPSRPDVQPPLGALAAALIYSDGRGGDASFVASGAAAGKAGFTLVGRDGQTYRLLRQLGGPGLLHRLTADGQAQVVSQDAAEIVQFLRAQAGLPSRAAFEQLCYLHPGQLPSRRPRVKPAGTAKASGKQSLANANAVEPAKDLGAAEARLRELQQELTRSQEVDAVQFRVDELSAQLFEAEQALQNAQALAGALQQAEAAYAAAPSLQAHQLPEDLPERVRRYEQALERRREALARLEADRLQQEEAASYAPDVEPLRENRVFLGGLAAGVVFLGWGMFLEGQGRYFALLAIPAFGVAALMALRHVEELQNTRQASRKEGVFSVREKKIRDDFEAETVVVHVAMRAFQVESPQDVLAVLHHREQLEQQVLQLRAQLAALEQDPAHARAAHHHRELAAQVEALNAELTRKGSGVREAREVEREMGRVRESIALARAARAQAAEDAAPRNGEPLEDPTPQVMGLCADSLTLDVTAASGVLKDRFLHYLSALTDRRYASVDWDREGRAALTNAQGQRRPVGEWPARDVDLYYLALRLTAVEKLGAREKLPLLIDDLFSAVEDTKWPLVARMLKHLGTVAQVLHVTTQPAFPPMSDGRLDV